MAQPFLRYDEIALHRQRGDEAVDAMLEYLKNNKIAFKDLDYDDQQDDLTAIAGWFDKSWTAPLAVLTFEKLKWESEDKTDRYTDTLYALKIEDLPSDFLAKAEKTE